METGRPETRAGLVRTAPAQVGLADVVCCFGNATGKSVVCRARLSITAGFSRREYPPRVQSFPRQTAALCPRHVLSLSVHKRRRAPSYRGMVETRGASRIPSNSLAGPVLVRTF